MTTWSSSLFYLRFSLILWSFLEKFLLCSFLPEASCAKKPAHCGKSCLALLAVRLPGNSALQNRENLYLQIVNASNSPSSAYSSHRTQRTGPQCALKTPCVVLFSYEFHKHSIYQSNVINAYCTIAVKRTIQGVLQRIGKIWQMSETQLQAGAGYV